MGPIAAMCGDASEEDAPPYKRRRTRSDEESGEESQRASLTTTSGMPYWRMPGVDMAWSVGRPSRATTSPGMASQQDMNYFSSS